jgi:hypothetical protein
MSEVYLFFTISLLQVLIAFGLMNVWLLRFNFATEYRGGSAQNMKEEFSAYGLPTWSLYVVGFLKISIALIMIATFFVPSIYQIFGFFSLVTLSILMIGAIYMHVKVHDKFKKILPAIVMLSMSILVIILVNVFQSLF